MDDLLDVEIVEIEDADKYLIRLNNGKTKLKEIAYQLNDLYKHLSTMKDTSDIKLIEAGQVYAVKCKHNWYRAKFLTNVLMFQKSINCYLIDVGKYELISSENLRILPLNLQEIKPLVMNCQLYGISLNSTINANLKSSESENKIKDKKALTFIFSLFDEFTLFKAKIIYEIYGKTFIQLFYLADGKNFLSVNDLLVKTDFANYSNNQYYKTIDNVKHVENLSLTKLKIESKLLNNDSSDDLSYDEIVKGDENFNQIVDIHNKQSFNNDDYDDDMHFGNYLLRNETNEMKKFDDFTGESYKYNKKSSDYISFMDASGIWLQNIPDIYYTKNLKNSTFFSDLSSKISDPLESVSLLQTYLWQLIPTWRNAICVAPSFRCKKFFGGKTYSYILPLVYRLCAEYRYSTYLPKYCTSPYIIIICPYSSSVEKLGIQIQDICIAFELYLICTYSAINQLDNEVNLINGCDILITTIDSLYVLVDRKIMNFKRVCHLVFEEFSQIIEFPKTQIERLFSDFALWSNDNIIDRIEATKLPPHQILFFSSKWMPKFNDYIKRFDTMCIISSQKECTYASGVQHLPIMCPLIDKENELMNILKNCHRIIFCTNDTDSTFNLSKILSKHNINHLSIIDDVKLEYSEEYLNRFNYIIIGDDVQNLANVANGICIVHWDLTDSAEKFFNRIWFMRENFNSNKELRQQSTKVKSILLINEEAHCKLICRHICKILERLNVDLPPYLGQLAEVENDAAEIRNDLQLCDNIKSFGFCRLKNCSASHKINKSIDYSSKNEILSLPDSGIIKVKILKVKNPTTYFAEILLHKNDYKPNSEFVTRKRLLIDINFFYQSYEGRLFLNNVTNPQERNIYAIQNQKSKLYERIQVLSINNVLEKAQVYYIDSGIVMKDISIHSIINLPHYFAEMPYQAIEVCICRLQPPENDVTWTNEAIYVVQQMLVQEEFFGTIVLKLGNTLWLDPLEKFERLNNLNLWNKITNVRQLILEKKIAAENSLHLDYLRKLYQADFLERSLNYTDKNVKLACTTKGQITKILYEKFPEEDGIHKILVSSCSNANVLFVQLAKNIDKLEKYVNEIQQFLSVNKLEPLLYLKLNALVLVKDSDNLWYRGQILEVQNENEASIFFIDYGDVKKIGIADLLPLPAQFQSLLCQAIKCKLADIDFCEHLNNSLVDKSEKTKHFERNQSDIIQDSTGEPNGGLPLVVHSEVIDKEAIESLNTYYYSIKIYIKNPLGYFEDLSYILIKNNLAKLSDKKIQSIITSDDFISMNAKSEIIEIFRKLQDYLTTPAEIDSEKISRITTNLCEKKNFPASRMIPILCQMIFITKNSAIIISLFNSLILCIKNDPNHCIAIIKSQILSANISLIHQQYLMNGDILGALSKLEIILKCSNCAMYFVEDVDGIFYLCSLLNLIIHDSKIYLHSQAIYMILTIVYSMLQIKKKKVPTATLR